MKKIRLLCIGRESKGFCKEGCNEYLKRLSPFYDVSVIEIPEKESVKREGEEIIRRMTETNVLMDIGGEMLSSEGFSRLLYDEHLRSDTITFIIGGPSGVDESVRALCRRRVSFGAVTYPHQLMRVLLCEQLYRAATILHRIPYHK